MNPRGRVSDLVFVLRNEVAVWGQKNPRTKFAVSETNQSVRLFTERLDDIDEDLKLRIGLSGIAYFADPQMGHKSYGCKKPTILDGDKGDVGTVWVVESPSSEKAFIVVSTAHPKRTTLLLFAPAEGIQLLYDSVHNTFALPLGANSGIDYVCGLELFNSERIVLHEGWLPGMSQASRHPRSFSIQINFRSPSSISIAEVQ